MLLWWAATSSAMPPDKSGALYEADGPAAHKLSLQPVRRGVHLQHFERTRTCTNGEYDGQDCCTVQLDAGERCEDKTYGNAGNNCHKFFYLNGAQYQPCRNPGPFSKKEGDPCKSTARLSTMVCGNAPEAVRAAAEVDLRDKVAAAMQKLDANELGVEDVLREIIKERRRSVDVLIELVDKGKIDANFAGNELPTPLMIAVHEAEGALQSVDRLIALGADANLGVTFTSGFRDTRAPARAYPTEGRYHSSPLHEACNVGASPRWGGMYPGRYYKGEQLDEWAPHGPPPAKETPERIEIVERLLASGARNVYNTQLDPDYDCDNEMYHHNWQPIHWAIFNGYTEIALRLVRHAHGLRQFGMCVRVDPPCLARRHAARVPVADARGMLSQP